MDDSDKPALYFPNAKLRMELCVLALCDTSKMLGVQIPNWLSLHSFFW